MHVRAHTLIFEWSRPFPRTQTICTILYHYAFSRFDPCARRLVLCRTISYVLHCFWPYYILLRGFPNAVFALRLAPAVFAFQFRGWSLHLWTSAAATRQSFCSLRASRVFMYHLSHIVGSLQACSLQTCSLALDVRFRLWLTCVCLYFTIRLHWGPIC